MENKENNTTSDLKDKATKILNDVKDDSKSFNKKDIDSGKGMAILSYIGILALIPFLAEKKNKFVIYHAKQGMNLFICEIIGSVAINLGIKISAVYIVIGFIDFGYQKWKFAEDMKMTKQEVKEEYKELEGDPEVKSHLESAQREILQTRR